MQLICHKKINEYYKKIISLVLSLSWYFSEKLVSRTDKKLEYQTRPNSKKLLLKDKNCQNVRKTPVLESLFNKAADLKA